MEKEYPIFYKTIFGKRVLVDVQITQNHMSGMIVHPKVVEKLRECYPEIKRKKLFTIYDGKELII